jgi:hypothetical protein
MENSVQIAWDYLERTGEIEDTASASRYLMTTIEHMIRQGEKRKLMLSNRAINSYKTFRSAERNLKVGG